MIFRRFSEALAVLAIVSGGWAAPLAAQEIWYPTAQPVLINTPVSAEAGIINEAAVVLQELTSGTVMAIPERLLASAEAIAIVPRFVRGAFVVGVSGGRGVLIRRDAHRNWQAPEFIGLYGGSIGWQAGIQATDLVLVFRSTRSLQNMQQGKVTLGGDVSVAAGPVGRTASAATDAALRAEILSYSRARGLYAGVSVNGSSLQLDVPAIQRYYQITPSSPGVVPPAALSLVNTLSILSHSGSPAADHSLRPAMEASPANPLPAQFDSSPTNLPGERELPMQAATIQQIAAEIASLQNKVDAQWQEYLVLPASWQQPASVTPSDIEAVVARYEQVASNPQFVALSQQPEFVRILGLLRQLANQAASHTQLNLPPPPAAN